MSDLAIETRGLTKTFGGMTAVDDLDLRVPQGSIFGYLGVNGAGKTTTIKLLLGLLRPDRGSAIVLGRDAATESLEIRKRVGYVSESQIMYDYMQVREIIEFSRALYPRWNAGTVQKYLEIFELPQAKRIKQLSKGMRTQLALVLALGPEPDLLILDEPTSGLDPIKRKEFLSTVLAEVSVTGQTVFMSSHQLAEVERLADWIAIIHQGRLQIACPADELKGQLKKIRVGFNQDPPAQLLTRPGIIRVEGEGRNYLLTIKGDLDAAVENLRQADYRSLEVLDLTLEDIFTELAGRDSRGQR